MSASDTEVDAGAAQRSHLSVQRSRVEVPFRMVRYMSLIVGGEIFS